MGKQDPILSQIKSNRQRYLADEKLRKVKINQEKKLNALTPQSVLEGTDPDYGAPEGFSDFTSFGDTQQQREDSAKSLIKSEVEAIEKAKKQQLLDQQKTVEMFNRPEIQQQFRDMNNFNAVMNQPGKLIDPNSLQQKLKDDPAAQEIFKKQKELGLTINAPVDESYFTKLGQIVNPNKKKVSLEEVSKNKVTNFLLDAGLYDKPISENIRGIIDPLVSGKDKIVKGADDVADGDVLRGSAQLVGGTLQTAMNMIPAVVGLNATMPIMNEVGGSVAEGLGLTRKQGEDIVGKVAPFLFGKWIGASSLASWGVDEGLQASGLLDNMSPEDQVITRELIGHLAFFGTLLGGKAITKKYLDPKLDEMFPYTRGMKADVTDPKVKRILDDYVAEFNEKKSSGMKKEEFNKWAHDRVGDIIKNEKPAFFRNIKRDLQNIKNKRTKVAEDQVLNVNPDQVNKETGFTDFKFEEPLKNAPKSPGTGVKQPTSELGTKILAGQEIVSPQRSIEVPKGVKSIITPKPGAPSGKTIVTPPEKLKQIEAGKLPIGGNGKDVQNIFAPKGKVQRDAIKINLPDEQILDINSRIEKSGGQFRGIGKGQKEKYDAIYFDPVVDHPLATPTTFSIPMEYYRKDPGAVNREVKRINKKYVDDLNKAQEKKKEAEKPVEPAIKPTPVPEPKIKVKPVAPKKVKKKVPGSTKQQVVDTKLSDIVKSEKDFQGRAESFSGESFKRIVTARVQSALDEGSIGDKKAGQIITAANNYLKKNNPAASELSIEDLTPENTFSWNDFGQVLLWEDPKGGLKLLSGHSRTAAAEFLKDYFDEFGTIPSMIEKGISFEDAQKKALQSNIKGTAESLLSHVKKIQVLRSKNKTEKEIKAVAKAFYGSDANKIVNISLLNPDGYTLTALRKAEKDPDLYAIANWIGSIKSYFPKLTTDHENEIYKWLVEDNAYKTIVKNMMQLNDVIDRRVSKPGFNYDEPLNLKNAKGKGGNVMQEYERELADKLQQLNNAKSDLEKARGKWAAKGLEGKDLEEKIAMDNAYVNRVEAEYQKLLLKKNAVIDAEMDQQSLFNARAPETILNKSEMVDFILDNNLRDSSGKLDLNDAKEIAGANDIWELKEIDPSQFDWLQKPGKKENNLPPIISTNPDGELEVLDGKNRIGVANYKKQKSILAYVGKNKDELFNARAPEANDKQIQKIQKMVDIEQEAMFPDEGKIQDLNNQIKKLKMQQAAEESKLGLDAEIIKKIKDKIDKGFDLEKSTLAELKNFQVQLESQKDKLSESNLKLLNKINTTIKARESVGEQTSLFAPDQESLFNAQPPDETNLKKWFGNSKVVNEFGDPAVVFHGTNDRFSTVRMNRGAQGVFWFSSNPQKITSGSAGASGTKLIMDLYVKIEKPAGWKEYEKYGLGQLQDLGYDGVILDDGEGGFDGFVFNSNQVKSASKNNGDYSSDKNSMLLSAGELRDYAGMSKEEKELTRLKDYKRHLELSLELVAGKEGSMPVVKGVTGTDYSPSYFRKEMQLREELADITMLIKKLEANIPKTVRLDNQFDIFAEAQEPEPAAEEKEEPPDLPDEPLNKGRSQFELFNARMLKESKLKKIKQFKTAEGKFEVWDVAPHTFERNRGDMFTVLKSKSGYVIRNSNVPADMQRKGIATEFYLAMNDESIRRTGHPLKSSPPRTLISGTTVTELSDQGAKLWDSFVAKGFAEKLGDKNYRFFGGKDPIMIEAVPEVRDLITVHNLTTDNLIFANQVGGLAMPSMAIVRKQLGFDKYGEISLIAPKERIDPEYGNKVFSRDIYSPTYPTVYRHIDKKLLWKKLQALDKILPDLISKEVSGDLRHILEQMEKESYVMTDFTHNEFLQNVFLKRTRQLPELLMKKEPLESRDLPEYQGQYEAAKRIAAKYPILIKKFEYQDDVVKAKMDELHKKSPEYYDQFNDNGAFLERHAKEFVSEEHQVKWIEALKEFQKEYVQDYLEMFNDDPELKKEMVELHQLDPDRRFDDYRIGHDLQKLLNPKDVLDGYNYKYKLVEPLIKQQEEKFRKFIEKEFIEIYGGEYIKAGKTKIPHTIDNAVDVMGGRLRGTEKTMVQGLGKSATISAREFISIADIKKRSDKIVDHEKFLAAEKEMKDKFMELSDHLLGYYKYKDDFGFDRLDNLSLAVGKIAASKMSDEKIALELYRADYRSVPDWKYDEIREVAQLMKNMPTEYFEAKMKDKVYLKEFSGALIPTTAIGSVKRILKKEGIKNIKIYDPDIPGDRLRVLNEFTDEMFHAGGSRQSIKDAVVRYNIQIFHEKSILLKNTNLNFDSKPAIGRATKEQWLAKRYDPIANNFKLLKEGDPGYETGKEIYEASIFGGTIPPTEANGWRGTINHFGGTDLATGLEETIHIFQAEVKRKYPELAEKIKEWEDAVISFGAANNIDFPLGEELFAKCFVAQTGHHIPDNAVMIPEDIYDAVVEILNESTTGEPIFDKYMKPMQRISSGRKIGSVQKGFRESESRQLQLFNARNKLQTDTPEFKQWFGNSKIVDENGKPKKLYHGTRSRFTEFKAGKNDIGIHLGTSAQAERRIDLPGYTHEHENIIPVFAKVENPLRLKDVPTTKTDDSSWNADHVADELVRLKLLSPKTAYLMDLTMLRDYIKDQGYDGIVYKNEYESRPEDKEKDSYIVFSPTQIKSAIGNKGTFDPNDPSILLSARAPGEPGTPRMDKYIKKVLEDMPEKLSPEKESRLKELNAFKELSAAEKKERDALRVEKANLLAADPFEKHRLSTLISMKIRNLKSGYKVGAGEKQKQLTDLKKDISAYARLILPRGEYRKSEITPMLTDLARANDLDGAAKVFNRIRDLERKVRKRSLISKINKLIRNADRTKGDPDFVIAIKNIRRMKTEDVEIEIAKIYERAANRELTDEEDQFLYLLQRFTDIKNKSVEDLEDLYQELKEAIVDGRSRRKEWLAAEKERIKDLKTKSIAVITGGKSALSDDRARAEGLDKETYSVFDKLSGLDTIQHSWEWIMDKLSKHDKTSIPLHSFLNEYFADKVYESRNVEDYGVRTTLQLIREKMHQVFGSEGRKLLHKLNKNSMRQETLAARVHVVERDEAGVPTRTENVRLVMSQNEAAYMIMVHEDPTLEKTFEKMGYTEDTWTRLKAFVDPEVMTWAKWQLQEFYPQYYAGVNAVYKQMRGVDLQFNKKYMPISRDVSQTVIDQEFLGDNMTEHISIFNGHLQPRVSNTQPIRIQDIDRVLLEHIIEMEHFKAFAAVMKDLRGVFGSREVGKAIKQYHSPMMLKVINRFVNDFARGGVDSRLTVNTLDKIRSNFAKSVIGLNPVVLIKQLTSFPAFLMDVPVKDFVLGIGDFLINPIGRAKFLMKNSEHLKSRYSRGWERDIILAMQRARKTTAKELSRTLNLTDIFMTLPKFGDAGSIFFGGWSVYKYHFKKAIKAGKTYDEAKRIGIKEFEKSTKRSQQAGDVEDLGELQRQGSWSKLWTLFQTSPKQYYSNMSGALRNLVFKRGKKNQNLKRLFVAHFLLPQLFMFTSNAFSWNSSKQLRALILGSANGLLIIGDILETMLDAAFGDTYFSQDSTPITAISNDFVKALKEINKWANSFDMTMEDFIESVDELVSALSKPLGVPYDPVKRVTTGIIDYVADPESTSPLRVVGFSDFILKEKQNEAKADTLQLIQERQNRLNEMKKDARKTMNADDIEKAKQYERDLKKLKEGSTDYKKQQQDLKDKKKDDPFVQPKKPKSLLGKQLSKFKSGL